MLSRALRPFALGLAIVACDGAKPKPDPAAESADKADDATEKAAASEEAPISIAPAPADPETWMEFSSRADRFEVRLPAAPQTQKLETPNPRGGTIPTTMYMVEQGSAAFAVGVTTFTPAALEAFDVDGALDGARNGMVNNIAGKLVSEKQVEFAGQPAREIVAKATAEGAPVRVDARLFYLAPRMYQVLVVRGESESVKSQKFFDSFSLLAE